MEKPFGCHTFLGFNVEQRSGLFIPSQIHSHMTWYTFVDDSQAKTTGYGCSSICTVSMWHVRYDVFNVNWVVRNDFTSIFLMLLKIVSGVVCMRRNPRKAKQK